MRLTEAPPLIGVDVDGFAQAILKAIAERPATDGPKPRVRLFTDGRMQFCCGWCGVYDDPQNLRTGILTGNCWPIHPGCYMAWYDGEDPPR